MKNWVFGIVAAFGLMGFGVSAGAQSLQPRLIRPAEFGTITEILGTPRLYAKPATACPDAYEIAGYNACFKQAATFAKANGINQAIVIAVDYVPQKGQPIDGAWGRDYFPLWVDFTQNPMAATALELPTSEVRVPVGCYALKGESVVYWIEARDGIEIAQESQIVSCGGGPRTPNGPYEPQGPAIPQTVTAINTAPIMSSNTYVPTGKVLAEGVPRLLAWPDSACAKENLVRETLCAAYAIAKLSESGDKEVDMIGAKSPVQEEQVLQADDVDQLVLKKRSKGFKADKRWFKKSYLNTVSGCKAITDTFYRVKSKDGGLWAVEQAVNACGAPPAPVPTDLYEAYGERTFILYCHGDRRGRFNKNGDGGYDHCFDGAREFLSRSGQKSDRFVVVYDRVREGDRLETNGYIQYDVANVSVNKEGQLSVERQDYYVPFVTLSGCTSYQGSDSASRGFVIERSQGILWATAFQWMNCPVY